MSKSEAKSSEKMSKKQARKLVYSKLAGALAEYNLNEKAISGKLKKASKLFAGDIARAANKVNGKTQKLKKVDKEAPVKQQEHTLAM